MKTKLGLKMLVLMCFYLSANFAYGQDISVWEKNITNKSKEARIAVDFLGLFEYYYLCGQNEKARNIVEQANNWGKFNNSKSLKESEALEYLNASVLLLSDPFKSRREMFNLAGIAKDDSISTLALLSYAFMNSFDEYQPEMDSIYKKLEQRKLIINNEKLSTRLLLYRALIYDAQNNRKKATETYLNVVAKAQKVQYPLAQAQAYSNLGSLFSRQQDTLSIYYQRKALEIYESIPQKSQYSNVLNNIGSTFISLKQYDSALKYLGRCIEHYQTNDKIFPLLQVYYNIGNAYREIKNIDSAEYFYNASLSLSDSLGIPHGLMYNQKGLGDLAMIRGKLRQATVQYSSAANLAEQLQEYGLLAQITDSLASISYYNRNIDQMKFWSDKRKIYADSSYKKNESAEIEAIRNEFLQKELLFENEILKTKNSEAQKDLRINTLIIYIAIGFIVLLAIFLIVLNYNLKKRRELFDLLFKEKKRTEEQNEDLLALNNEVSSKKQALELKQKELLISNNLKDSILSIISHDLRSPLANISQLILLMQMGHLDQKEFDEIIGNLDKEVKQNLILLDNLLLWSKSHIAGESNQLGKIQVKEIVREILALYEKQINEKKIFTNIEVPQQEELRVSPEVLSIILRNIISNSIKFSHPKGTLSVSSFKEGKWFCITVSDQGIGMSQEQIDALFTASKKSTRGTSNEKGYGLGLKFVNEIISKIGGDIKVESLPDKGSKFTIYFPR